MQGEPIYSTVCKIPRNWAVAKSHKNPFLPFMTNGLFGAINIYPSAIHFLFVSPPNGEHYCIGSVRLLRKRRKFVILSVFLFSKSNTQHNQKTIFDQQKSFKRKLILGLLLKNNSAQDWNEVRLSFAFFLGLVSHPSRCSVSLIFESLCQSYDIRISVKICETQK